MTDTTLAPGTPMSRTVIDGKLRSMGRWEPNSRRRLQEAALELYAERGFAETSVAAVAERAGLTERTFFRYFPDKREVLFDGEDRLRALLVGAVGAVPGAATPLEAVTAGLGALVAEFQPRRDTIRKRARIVAAYPELRERELIKLASWSAALEEALRGRGITGPAAKVAGEVGVAVFHAAYQRWTDGGQEKDLAELVGEALVDLRALVGSTPAS